MVTAGAEEIVAAYRRLGGAAAHAEFLIDRQGYIRARWTGGPGETRPIRLLLADVQQLRRERAAAPASAHVH